MDRATPMTSGKWVGVSEFFFLQVVDHEGVPVARGMDDRSGINYWLSPAG